MKNEGIVTTVALDIASSDALKAMSKSLGISKSAIMRILISDGWKRFQKEDTLPYMNFRQLDVEEK